MKNHLIVIGITLVLLTVGLNGCTSQESTEKEENEKPSASCSANPTSGEVPLTVSFNGYGTDVDGTINSYHWDFGDGTSSSSKSPTHTYQNSGTYTAKLTVTDNDGETDTKSLTITVEEKSKIIDVDILQHTAYYRDVSGTNNGVIIYGLLKNKGDTNIAVRVTASFYNEHDYVVYEKEGNGQPAKIKPGGKSFFDVFASGNLDYSYYKLEFTGYEVSTSDYTDFTYYIQSSGIETIFDNDHHSVSGTVYNDGSSTAYFVHIYAILYDEYGNLLGYGHDFLVNPEDTYDKNFFPPGTSKSFSTWCNPEDITSGDLSKIASYEIIVWTPYGGYRHG